MLHFYNSCFHFPLDNMSNTLFKYFSFCVILTVISTYMSMDYITKDRRPCDNGDRFSVGKFNRDLNLLLNDTEIDKMGEDNLTLIYWKYINTLQVLCRNQMRVGSIEDGGKEVCLDEKYKPKYPCIVYSFGSNFDFGFEVSIIKHFNCKVYTFDPTSSKKGKHIPKGINFHRIGLSNINVTNAKVWKLQTLSSIRKMLNHTDSVLDILKIDIEGDEWNALPEMFMSGVLKYVKQLCIEVHFGRVNTGRPNPPNWGYASSKYQLKVLMELYKHGFRIFMHEHNLFPLSRMSFKQPYGNITAVNEISLINTRW